MINPEQGAQRSRVVGQGTKTRVIVSLSAEEIATLRQIANYYERNWGVFRHVVRAVSGRQTRLRFQLVAQEAMVLEKFLESASDSGEPVADANEFRFTPLALVALWGRLLSSLASPHARRKLRSEEIVRRERIGQTLEDAAATLFAKQPRLLLEQIATRRLSERSWMHERLGIPDDASTRESEPSA